SATASSLPVVESISTSARVNAKGFIVSAWFCFEEAKRKEGLPAIRQLLPLDSAPPVFLPDEWQWTSLGLAPQPLATEPPPRFRQQTNYCFGPPAGPLSANARCGSDYAFAY